MNGEPNYNLLALSAMAHPSGARLVAALSATELIKQRQAFEQRQKELESQLSAVEGYGLTDDPMGGLDQLNALKISGLRPEAAKRIHEVRQDLTGRAAARAVARAKVMDSPGSPATTQAIPFSPDRPERAGQPAIQAEDADARYRRMGDAEQDAGQYLYSNRDRVAVPPGPVFPVGGEMPEGPAAEAAIPGTPPTYRPPRSQEETREALSERERELYLLATNFKGEAPDLAAVEMSVHGKTQPSTIEELDAMVKGLEEQFNELPGAEQAAMSGQMRTVRAATQIAKKNPKALLRTIGTVERFQTMLQKHRTDVRKVADRKAEFDARQERHQDNLKRVDLAIKQKNFEMARALVTEMQDTIMDLPRMIREVEDLGKEYQPLAESMRRYWFELQGKVRHRRELLMDEADQPTPSPATGKGTDPARTQRPQPGSRIDRVPPPQGKTLGTTPPPEAAEESYTHEYDTRTGRIIPVPKR